MSDILEKLITNTSNFAHGRQGNAINLIILHTEGSAQIEGMADRSLYEWFQTNGHQVSAHYYVTFSGQVEQYVLDSDTAYQAGNFPVNLRSIGIEHQDNGSNKDANAKYTDDQYEASANLVASLCSKHGIPVQYVEHPLPANPHGPMVAGVTIHRDLRETSCPDALDFQRIIDRAKQIADGQAMAK